MKTKVLSIILLGASLGLGSCSDYLDMTPTDRASDKLVWSKLDYAEQAVNDFYRYIDYLGVYRDGQCLAGMTEALTDQLKYGSYNYMSKCQIPSEIAYGGSVLTVNYVSTYLGNWGTMYEYVRRVNEGINKLKKYASFGQADEERLEAEMRFFRGYLYTDLLKRYKEVIIYDENLDNIKKDMPVSSEADGWNFVYNDLKYAGEHLPVDKTPNGRLTSGAAYAMLSRAMLYAERWDDARIAAEKVMGMGYELAAKEDYSNALKAGSKEAILQYCYDKRSTVTHDFDGYMVPGGDKALDGNSMTGGFGTPTQEMVESYEYADGSGFPDWSAWHTAEGTTTTPPYDKLEPRFKATILYNGATWKGRPIESFVNGTDGWAAWKTDAKPEGRSTTGYYLRKLVDEAHNYKNLAIFSKINNVSGISGSGAKKATDMQLKCQYINEINPGRGIVFATGTPISNTMCEMYVMQSYLQKDTLEQMGIYHFDSWAANFGEITTALELTVEGSGFRMKNRFNKFTNLPELMNIFKQVADVQTQDMLELNVPKLRDGKYIIVESEPDWYVRQIMEDFVRRAEAIRNGGVDSSIDNFLKITHEARLLGTDARLLDKDAPNNPDGKLNKVIDNVFYEY